MILEQLTQRLNKIEKMLDDTFEIDINKLTIKEIIDLEIKRSFLRGEIAELFTTIEVLKKEEPHIKTKFNIGDTVWAVSRRFNEEKDDFELVVNSTPRIINRIDICCDKDETDITYHTEHIDGSRDILYYNEEACFATKEQAEEYIRRTE